jgi:ferritin-like metal-binding protein YciE
MLQQVPTDQLRDLLHAENQLVKALPKMVKAAKDDQLRAAFTGHLEETKGHSEGKEKEALPVGLSLIAAAQRVEHYEIAAHGTSAPIATHMNRKDAAELLSKTLEEEKHGPRSQPE